MLRLEIEYTFSGPLSRARARQDLTDAVTVSDDFDALCLILKRIPTLAFYRGGHHIAIHESIGGELGSCRLAIVTDGKP